MPRRSRLNHLGRVMAERAGDLLPLSDFIGVLLAGLISPRLQSIWPAAAELPWQGLPGMIWIAAAIAPFILYNHRFATWACAGDKSALAYDFSRRFLVYLGVITAIGYAGHWAETVPLSPLAVWLLISALIVAGGRMLLARYLRRLVRQSLLLESVAVIGTGPLADQTILRLRGNARLYGLFDDRPAGVETGTNRATGTLDDLVERAHQDRPDRILIALPEDSGAVLLDWVARLRPLGIAIELCQQSFSPLFERPQIENVSDCLPVILLADRPIRRWNQVLKSGKDLALASALIVLLLPLLALIALAVKLDSPGPVLFRQRRYGLERREFEIYKFRTMHSQPPALDQDLQQTLRGDPRITRVGRWLRNSSLDELPQIFNVIRGSMSLVGPRPHAVDMRTERQLGHEITDRYPQRYRVKPGITGWSQVNGARGATDTAEQLRQRVELDLHYVDNWSLKLDLKILARTFREVVRGTNAY